VRWARRQFIRPGRVERYSQMLIGIDGSRATVADPTGTENYSARLIKALLKLNTDHQIRLYFNRPPAAELGLETSEHRVMPFPRLWTHLRLSWEMKQNPPDVLFVPSHVLPIVHPYRSVVTVHDLGFYYHPEAHTLGQNLYLRWSTRFNARQAVRIVADSEFTRNDLAESYGIAKEKMVVVYPGRDESLSPVADQEVLDELRARYSLPQSYLLYVGTLHPRKNLVRLVQAFRLAADRLAPDLCLVLSGRKGWMYDDIYAEVERQGLANRVRFTGYVAQADMAALLSAAKAFVFPSLHEGFGFPVLEAMACGTPVLTSDRASLPEVAGNAALYVDPLDIEAMGAALVRVVSDQNLRLELVERGFDQIHRFSWRRCAEATLEVLEAAGRHVP
jgi:glycosyltransferase involved in cell wall biosynthesis